MFQQVVNREVPTKVGFKGYEAALLVRHNSLPAVVIIAVILLKL
jgi:hypothetical protein